jgi:putative SOS response-associated peptidase YedK
MCGRYEIRDGKQIFVRYPVKTHLPDNQMPLPNLNVAPTNTNPVLLTDYELRFMRWGLVPPWAKDLSISTKMINARAETVSEKASFKKPLRERRCLVPMSAYYEWKAEGSKKQPYRIAVAQEEMFSVAGLYEIWHRGQPDELFTYTIITTSATQSTLAVHDRMPVILHQADEATWLNPDITEPELLLPLLVPYPADAMIVAPTDRDLRIRRAS